MNKVLPINREQSVINEGTPEVSRTWAKFFIVLFVRINHNLGFMQNQNDPQKVNGTAILFAILFALSIILYMFKSTILFAFFMDSQMQGEALDQSSLKRIEDKYNRSETKRAQIIDFLRRGGKFQDLPLELQIFESSQADKDQLHREDKK